MQSLPAFVGVETVRLRLRPTNGAAAHSHAGTAGFTLVEALAATALMGVV